jgi:hypothetical protein
MTARHWMPAAAFTVAWGLAGSALAFDTSQATSTDLLDNPSVLGFDTPSAGAIVTPEDKAMGLGKEDGQAGPGAADPRSRSRPAEDDSGPPRTGSDVQPGDMGPRNVRGE